MQRRAFLATSVSALAAPPPVKALLFDVFGTVVDWHGTIVKEGITLNRKLNLNVEWSRFALDWRAGYAPSMDRVRSGAMPWTRIDALHRQILEELIPKYGLGHLSEPQLDQLNRVWHRLDPWPDSVPGLQRLKSKYIISTLSNGNVSLLTNMAKHAKLPWDCVLSAELFRHYKPDPEAYLGAADMLDLKPNEVMLVAAHSSDLQAAARVGLLTAFIHRPFESGKSAVSDTAPPGVAYSGKSFLDLATYFGT